MPPRPAIQWFSTGQGGSTSASRIAQNKANGDAAADAIAARYPGARREVDFQATSGVRRVDVWGSTTRVAIESKVGRTSLTAAVRQQVQRDVELMSQRVFSSVEWHFARSRVTGLQGPTKPLLDLLRSSGIIVR
ncbi:hypothetical protein FHX49_000498 [Microbacterium endophyticum]|uniref:Tox-REase-7 domain-containing protein n=1 Tax=Microbacterium endophyticum TaxID=1526412 RepID=A0A7W4V161_9MICO|nr:hypothetical protein [Microbacterium endophyticum]MBB2974957.1 hypothetical protein [Microbacterium endophyticum]NIK37254.1 hypothetical protein [Microbacterium endophyticum]